MRIFDLGPKAAWPMLAVLLVATSLTSLPAAAQQRSGHMRFKSPEAAYQQGVATWKQGLPALAIPAFRYASDHHVFLARFTLAQIYGDNSTGFTDHAAAYRLYNGIAREFANIDPEEDQRGPYVAKSLIALARYVRDGIASINLKPDAARAAEYFRHAALFFNSEDAQFELSRLYLDGEGVRQDTRTGLHYLSMLAKRGHAGAQAFLADVYWRGRYGMARNEREAFALIKLAMLNAPASERIWIEDIYQNIFCGMSASTRAQAEGLVADWRQRYGRDVIETDRLGLGALPPRADRTCGNGEPVAPVARKPVRSTDTRSVMRSGVLDIGATGVPGR
jgi:TPR repeat protein